MVLADFAVDDASLEVNHTRLFEFAIKCREEALFPCLCFQLDSFRCLVMFKDLLGQLESRQLLECVFTHACMCMLAVFFFFLLVCPWCLLFAFDVFP